MLQPVPRRSSRPQRSSRSTSGLPASRRPPRRIGIAAQIDKIEAGLPFIAETAKVRERLLKLAIAWVILDSQLKLSEQRHDLIVQKRRVVEAVAAKAALEASREQTSAEYARGVITDLAEAEQKAAQFNEDIIKAERKMEDQVLRAPVDGTVEQLAIHTVGGVVTPAQQLMAIVPAASRLEAEVMVPNRDIGFVTPGQSAEVKIDTFNFTKYGMLQGEVMTVSQDAIVREKPADRMAGPTRVRCPIRANLRARSWSMQHGSRSIALTCRSTTGTSSLRRAWP